MSGVINKLRKQNKTLAFFNVKTYRRLKKKKKKQTPLFKQEDKAKHIFWGRNVVEQEMNRDSYFT